MVGLRVVPAGRNGNQVYGRTLNIGELDDGNGITLNVGDRLIYPDGSLKITLKDVDKYAQAIPSEYAPITNTVWTWSQIPPHESEKFFNYTLALARRLDQAHALYVQVMQKLDQRQEETGIPARNQAFNALADAESMCLALSRAIRMISNASNKIDLKTSVPPGLQAIEEPVTAIPRRVRTYRRTCLRSSPQRNSRRRPVYFRPRRFSHQWCIELCGVLSQLAIRRAAEPSECPAASL